MRHMNSETFRNTVECLTVIKLRDVVYTYISLLIYRRCEINLLSPLAAHVSLTTTYLCDRMGLNGNEQ